METGKYFREAVIAFCLAIPAMIGCSQQARDQQIKADITVKAKEDVNFAGVRFTVQNSRVTLMGSCPTFHSKSMVKQKLSSIYIIDSVVDRLQIGPVTMGTSFAVKQQVDSILASYPTVIAAVSDDSVALIGSVPQKDLSKLLESVGKLVANTTTDRLTTTQL
jgi:hypothetical protein